MSLREAIESYHELLSDELASESFQQLDEQQRRRGLFFGGRPLCSVLRPRFLTREQYHFLQSRMHLLLQAFDKAYLAALADKDFRSQFGLLDWEEELVQYSPGFRDPSPTSRVDTFFVTERGGLRLTEYNADTPASPAYNDALSEMTYGLPVMREFLRRYEVRPLPARHSVLHTLIDAYQQWGNSHKAPRIAILDWREVPSFSEFVLFAEYFKSQGLECIITDPREVEYTNGRLVAGDFHITLIYKRVLITELIERGGMDHPVVRAVRDHAACMVNSFRCKILHRKTSLAVLSDEQNSRLFTPAERDAARRFIPWTRLVAERQTEVDGATVDLVAWMQDNKDRLVLKPADEYGGKGIVLGWTVEQGMWESAIADALQSPTIVQERVELPREDFPALLNNSLNIYSSMLDTDPYIWYGDYMSGCLTRISTAALLNVTAGGGSTVPTYVIERRD